MTGCIRTAGAKRYGALLVAGLAIGIIASCDAGRSPARSDTPEQPSLVPTGLDAVQQGCRTNQPWATDAVCREAAEAIRRRFRGDGALYTPHRVDPFPNPPTMRGGPAEPTGTENRGKRPSDAEGRIGKP